MPVPRKLGITVNASSQPCQTVCGRHGADGVNHQPTRCGTAPQRFEEAMLEPSIPAPMPNAAAMTPAALTCWSRVSSAAMRHCHCG